MKTRNLIFYDLSKIWENTDDFHINTNVLHNYTYFTHFHMPLI